MTRAARASVSDTNPLVSETLEGFSQSRSVVSESLSPSGGERFPGPSREKFSCTVQETSCSPAGEFCVVHDHPLICEHACPAGVRSCACDERTDHELRAPKAKASALEARIARFARRCARIVVELEREGQIEGARRFSAAAIEVVEQMRLSSLSDEILSSPTSNGDETRAP